MGFGKRTGFVSKERQELIRASLERVQNKHNYTGPEQRAVRRQKTLKACRIIFNNKMSVIDGTVVDFDHAGAKIKVQNAFQISKEFILQMTTSGETYACTIMWHNNQFVGVKFNHNVNLNTPQY